MPSQFTISPPVAVAVAVAVAAANASVDVRAIARRERHPLIFSTCRALATGQSLELANDHDPLPLYDHFQTDQPGGFG